MAPQVKNTSTLGTKKGPALQPGPETLLTLRRKCDGDQRAGITPHSAIGLTIFSSAAWICALSGAKASCATLVATSLSLVL